VAHDDQVPTFQSEVGIFWAGDHHVPLAVNAQYLCLISGESLPDEYGFTHRAQEFRGGCLKHAHEFQGA